MSIQTVEFQATPGQSITVRRFARYGDTILDAVAATERTNKRGWYAVNFDTTGGIFDLSFMVGSNCIGVDQVELTDTVATFQTNGVKAGQSTDLVAAIWSAGTRTITSFGTLVADVATAVWSAATRTLSSFESVGTDLAAVKAKTDQLTFGTANQLDCRVVAMAANTLTASALATDAVTEIVTGVSALKPGVNYRFTNVGSGTGYDVVIITVEP